MIYHRLWLGSASNYRIINIFIFKDLVFRHVHEFIFLVFYIASMTRFVEIFRKLFELRLANYTFFSKINILNYVVLAWWVLFSLLTSCGWYLLTCALDPPLVELQHSLLSFYCAMEGKMGEENEDEGTKYYIQHRCKFFLMML
jgi:hypothetical protein